jgi:hypothetical protein
MPLGLASAPNSEFALCNGSIGASAYAYRCLRAQASPNLAHLYVSSEVDGWAVEQGAVRGAWICSGGPPLAGRRIRPGPNIQKTAVWPQLVESWRRLRSDVRLRRAISL